MLGIKPATSEKANALDLRATPLATKEVLYWKLFQNSWIENKTE